MISCDQEGGNVQVLQGQGFSQIPDGLTQGSWTADKLQKESQTWGSELYAAGVNFDLAPVADKFYLPTLLHKMLQLAIGVANMLMIKQVS